MPAGKSNIHEHCFTAFFTDFKQVFARRVMLVAIMLETDEMDEKVEAYHPWDLLVKF